MKTMFWERRLTRHILDDVSEYEFDIFIGFDRTATQKYCGLCVVCGEWFEAMRSDKRYCSPECYATIRHPKIPVQCGSCCKTFTPTRKGHIYCSNACRMDGWRKSIWD